MARSGLAELRSFGKQFWLVNTIEMLERGAYYGMISVLVLHFTLNRGYDIGLVGALNGVLQFLLYFVPPFAAAIAEKYGYRPGMMGAFVLATLGYLAIAFTGTLEPLMGQFSLLPGLVLLGIGAGTFKPIAAAAIARATSEQQRNLAFTIYYAGVNVGGFLGPLLIGLLLPQAQLGLVFYGCAAFLLVNLVIAALVYRNPAPPQKDKSLGDALRTIGGLRRDPLYLALLLCYAGFWFMYAQQQFFLPRYASDFGLLPPNFNAVLVATINPATIIFIGPVIGKLTNRLPSLPVVVSGVLLYIVGYLMVAVYTNVNAFVAGTVLFSVGEVMVQPSFLSYTSKVAPKDRVAVYLGYTFVPVGIGLTLGSAVGGITYHQFAEVAHTPSAYWALSCFAGVISMAGILGLNRILQQRRPDPSGELSPRARRVVHSRVAPIAVFVIVPILLLAAVAPGAQTYLGASPAGNPLAASSLVEVKLPSLQGQTAKGQTSAQVIDVPAGGANLSLTLRWTDEAPGGPGQTNQPDTFRLHVRAPDGSTLDSQPIANPPGGEGRIALNVPGGAGRYNVTIEDVQNGDVVLGVPLGPPVTVASDGGNAWTLDASYRAPAS